MRIFVVKIKIPSLKFNYEKTVEVEDNWRLHQVEQWIVAEIRNKTSAKGTKGKKLILDIQPEFSTAESFPRTIVI